MQTVYRGISAVLVAALMLSACGKRDRTPDLMNIRANTSGPDEFSILPGKPLESPESFSELPEPTPGGSNLTDPTPDADAIAALGGNPNAITRDGIVRGDQRMVSHVTRYGVAPGIRQTLAAEDLEFRRKNNGRILERLFNVNVYFRAYRAQSLDQHAELARFRRLGVRTPSAPPELE